MTISPSNAALFGHVPEPTSSRQGQTRKSARSGTGYVIGLLFLGVASLASSIAFMASMAIDMPILTEQFHSLATGGHWNAVPLGGVLARTGYPLHSGGAPMVDWLLAWDSSLLIALTAVAFGWMVWMFERARRV